MHHGIQHLLVFGILLPYLLKGKRMSLLNCDCHSMNREKKKKKVGNRMCVVWNRKGRLNPHDTE